jgi:hypothetical protein
MILPICRAFCVRSEAFRQFRKYVFLVLWFVLSGTAAAVAGYSQAIDTAQVYYVGSHEPYQLRRFWFVLNALEEAYIFGGYNQTPALGYLENPRNFDTEEGNTAGYDGASYLTFRAHQIPLGEFSLSLYLDRYNTSYPRNDDQLGYDILGYDRITAGLGWRDAVQIGARRLSEEATGNELIWGVEANLLSLGNLFPGLRDVEVSAGDSPFPVVVWDRVSLRNLVALGNDNGITSNIFYTGLPVLSSVVVDRYIEPDYAVGTARLVSNEFYFPASLNSSWDLSSREIVAYEASFNYLLWLVGTLSYFLADHGLSFAQYTSQARENLRRWENGEPLVQETDQVELTGFPDTTVTYRRSFRNPYVSVDEQFESESLSISFRFGLIVGGYAPVFLDLEAGVAGSEAGDDSSFPVGEFLDDDYFFRVGFGTGLGERLLRNLVGADDSAVGEPDR